MPIADHVLDTRAVVTTSVDAAGGCDGIKTGRLGFHTASNEQDPWWQVDLGDSHDVQRVVIYNRTDGKTAARTRSIQVLVADPAANGEFQIVYRHNGEVFYGAKENRPLVVQFEQPVTARIVRLQVPGRCSFALDEVEIYAAGDATRNIAVGKPADQKSVSPYSAPSPRGEPQPEEAPTPAPPLVLFSFAHTQHVLRQANELAARLAPQVEPERMNELRGQLPALAQRLAELQQSGEASLAERQQLHFAARRLQLGRSPSVIPRWSLIGYCSSSGTIRAVCTTWCTSTTDSVPSQAAACSS